MHRYFRSPAVAWVVATVTAVAALLSWRDAATPITSAPACPIANGDPPSSPRWVLPQERARELARREGRPLLLVSLNGNLDGYC